MRTHYLEYGMTYTACGLKSYYVNTSNSPLDVDCGNCKVTDAYRKVKSSPPTVEKKTDEWNSVVPAEGHYWVSDGWSVVPAYSDGSDWFSDMSSSYEFDEFDIYYYMSLGKEPSPPRK